MSSFTNPSSSKVSFLRDRLGSFLAFAPLSLWTGVHLWHNLSAFRGSSAWQEAVTGYSHPLAQACTFFVVFVPIFLHTVWGIKRLGSSRPNNLRYGFYANMKYLLQRMSAVGVLLFLMAHVWKAFLEPRLVEGHAETFQDISHQMHHHMPTLVVYLLGTLGVAYHVANGMQTWVLGWGFVTSRRALARFDKLSLLLFGFLLAMSWGSLYALWIAGS